MHLGLKLGVECCLLCRGPLLSKLLALAQYPAERPFLGGFGLGSIQDLGAGSRDLSSVEEVLARVLERLLDQSVERKPRLVLAIDG